ncbi:MAG TPA: YraN family protein [Anaerolineae bacterium]
MEKPASALDGRKTFGRLAEDRAADYLTGCGYTLLARNWRTRGGELDIIARDGVWLVFVEVRARHGDSLGRPEESVTRRKQARLAALATAYLAQCGWEGPWRIDVIALRYGPGGRVDINHFADAIGGPG